jgi:hypothetical protein
VLEGAGHELPVQDPVQPSIAAALLGGRLLHGERPCPGGSVGVDQQIARDAQAVV